ncbi:MAG: DUF58 domain-containing protein, partial [Pirellulales bacterium]
MRIRPGRNLVRIAGGLMAVSLLTFIWPLIAWLMFVALIVSIVIGTLDYSGLRRQFGQISFERTLPAIVGRDMPLRVALQIRNSDRDPLKGELRDQLPLESVPTFRVHQTEVAAGGVVDIVASSRIPVRGQFEFGPVWLRLRGRFDILDGQQLYDCRGSVKVLPEAFSSEESLKQDELSAAFLIDKLASSRQHGTGTEFVSLAEYRQGDDPRRIDWRATARHRYPIVRRYQIERHRDVMILIDCGRLMAADVGSGSKLDSAVDSALMLCRVALESGDRCGVAVFDNKVVGYLPPVAGPRS